MFPEPDTTIQVSPLLSLLRGNYSLLRFRKKSRCVTAVAKRLLVVKKKSGKVVGVSKCLCTVRFVYSVVFGFEVFI